MIMRFPAKKNAGCPKAPRDFAPRKNIILHPPSGCPVTPLALPQSLYWRTLTSQPKFLGWIDYQIFLAMVLRWRASLITLLTTPRKGNIITQPGSCLPVGCLHRCLYQRLGSPLWQSVNSRSMASCQNNPAHKRFGIAGHSEGSPPLPPSDQRQASDVPLRQQLSSRLPAESGVHSLVAHVPPNLEHPPGVAAAQYHPVSETHPRSEYPS